ncbi:MAG TPA: glucose-6-phosphate dehydrogenase [Dehalococcoidia bacterium]|nr:glucose-6-phosphate dehydrogenase [Dehalococcoidia bacterium]
MSEAGTAAATLAGAPAERAPEPCALVIFGASGDLTRRMLLPALYNLALDRRLPPRFAVVGFARTAWSDEEFRAQALAAVKEFSRRPVDAAAWESFAENLYYVPGEYDDPEAHQRLAAALKRLEQECTGGNHLYYLAVPPSTAPLIVEQLGACGLVGRREERTAWSRVIVEKPFGRDLESAQELNRRIHTVFREQQVYRIDHYLGKETVQNILVFRFANGIFEPIWNRRYVDHVQITVAESIGILERGTYYEEAGALRDIVQNHMMQLLSLVAMEPPIAFEGRAVRDEKVKVLHAVRRLEGAEVAGCTARGQYGPGTVAGEAVPGYRQEPEVAAGSPVETFAALKLHVDNWRWADVPFYLRTGKRLPKRSTEVAIQFKRVPLLLFRNVVNVSSLEANVLTMRIQPNEGISLKFQAKVPGAPVRVRPVDMDFMYGASFEREAPSAHETLLLDALRGDATLFTRSDEMEAAWGIVTDILDVWRELSPPSFPNYDAGTWGPPEADELIARDGRQWREL